LSSYYEILGITPLAGSTEIKSAFRRLAKQYHPDKNPREKELFASILKAYETLIDPGRRAAYDRQLNYSGSTHANSSRRKHRSAEESELRRRRYYEEHIKQYEKRRPAPTVVLNKNPYNEFKYILFAAPLAVALVLLILRLAAPASEVKDVDTGRTEARTARMCEEEGPYTAAFGEASYDTRRNKSVLVNNNMGNELVVCFFNNKVFLRSCLIQKGELVELPQMPAGPYELRYLSGIRFLEDCILSESGQMGAFQITFGYYKGKVTLSGKKGEAVELNSKTANHFIPISEKEFFNLQEQP
jgi:DnaJ-domain-containing protein 1